MTEETRSLPLQSSTANGTTPERRHHLNATGCADAILRALANRCVVVEHVSLEFQAGRDTGARTIPSGRPDEGSVLIPYARVFTL